MANKKSKINSGKPKAQGATSSEGKKRNSADPATEAENETPGPRSPGPTMPKKPKREGMTDREWAHASLTFYRDRTTANFESPIRINNTPSCMQVSFYSRLWRIRWK
ncbi:hypothetical protein ACHAPQ_009058 [Fusarium lateritium]